MTKPASGQTPPTCFNCRGALQRRQMKNPWMGERPVKCTICGAAYSYSRWQPGIELVPDGSTEKCPNIRNGFRCALIAGHDGPHATADPPSYWTDGNAQDDAS